MLDGYSADLTSLFFEGGASNSDLHVKLLLGLPFYTLWFVWAPQFEHRCYITSAKGSQVAPVTSIHRTDYK